jgi:hypothetical protein
MDLPQSLTDVECYVNDFNTGADLGSGRCDLNFIEHTDRLRLQRALFAGEYHPASPEDFDKLKAHVVAAFSSGVASHLLYLDVGDRTYAFTVRFELGDDVFPFSGRAEPRVIA